MQQRKDYYVYKHRLQNKVKGRKYCVIVTRQYEEDHKFDSLKLAGAFIHLVLRIGFPECKIPEYVTKTRNIKALHKGEETELLGIISGMRRAQNPDKNLEHLAL